MPSQACGCVTVHTLCSCQRVSRCLHCLIHLGLPSILPINNCVVPALCQGTVLGTTLITCASKACLRAWSDVWGLWDGDRKQTTCITSQEIIRGCSVQCKTRRGRGGGQGRRGGFSLLVPWAVPFCIISRKMGWEWGLSKVLSDKGRYKKSP